MSKLYYLIASFVTLCISGAYAQTESRALSIEDLFRLADENNRSIRAHSTAVAEVREDVKTAKNAYLPSIDASLSLSYNGNGTITDRNFINAFATPIPHFGNNFALEVSQVVFAGGAISGGVKITELQLQNLNYNKIQLQNTVSLLNNQLTVAAGLPQSLVIVADIEANNYSTQQKPDHTTALSVQIAEKAEKIAAQAGKIVRAERLPQIALFAGDYFNGPITIEIPVINKNFNYWAVGVGIKYSLGNLYKSGAKIRAAGLAATRASEEKAIAEEHISLAVEDAFTHYREACSLLETKEKSVELATQNYTVVAYRYENDLALLTDLLDAVSQKLDAELQVINAKINIIFNYYKLKYISGIL
jgi:outer membrane protein TolC